MEDLFQDPLPSESLPQLGTDFNIVRTETVVSRLPVHNLDKHGRIDIQILKRKAGGEVELRWEVSYNERYGQARQLAYKLDTIVIDRRIEDAGKPVPQKIRLGSLKEICRDLGLAENGVNTDSVKRALRQNAFTSIVAKIRYRANNGTERTVEAAFTRYSVVLTGEKFPDGRKADAVYILLSEPYREILINAPTRPLDLDYKKQLAPAPQRFYEIVSYKIFSALKFNQPYARITYSEYCMLSAQQRYYDYDHFKKQMYKLHRPHLLSGYITKVNYEAALDEEQKSDWLMFYTPGPKARAEYAVFTEKKIQAGEMPAPPLALLPAATDHPQLAALIGRGVSEMRARKILAELPADFPAIATLEWGDQQIASQPGKFSNPPGLYIRLLEERVVAPPVFESSKTRKARQRTEAAQVQAEQQELALRADEEERQKLDAQIAALPLEASHALFLQAKTEFYAQYPHLLAVAKAHPDAGLHDGAIQARMRSMIRDGWKL